MLSAIPGAYHRGLHSAPIRILCILGLLTGAIACSSQPSGGGQDATDVQDAARHEDGADADCPDAGGQAAPDGGGEGRDDGGHDAGGEGRDVGGHDAGSLDAGERTCSSLPPTSDYGAEGPFDDVQMITDIGPGNNYTLFRPGASLGKNGFKHPLATWGNGISTTPKEYQSLLKLIASHGFVVIACNDMKAEGACLSAGLDWLIAQNGSGPMEGKLDMTREVTIGYSWGGGAAIDAANRPNVKATVSLHGMPPRGSTAFADMHSPLLLFTSTGDSFVTADKYVTPNYDSSRVQTFYATLNDSSVGHLYVVDVGSIACVAAVKLGACGSAKVERAPTVAWLRMLACDDSKAREYFYGSDCSMCRQPWTAQKKNWPQPDAP